MRCTLFYKKKNSIKILQALLERFIAKTPLCY
nr:MAG TPA: hypothetical protein [Caudoviricetes sp.]